MSKESRRNFTGMLRAIAIDAVEDKLCVQLLREPGRRQVYDGSDGKRYQLRVSDWLGFLEDAEGNHWKDAVPALEGPDAADLLLVCTTDWKNPHSALVYCVPVDVAAKELHETHKQYCSDTPDGRKGDSRRALWFRPAGQRTSHKEFYGYEDKWQSYLVAQVPLPAVESKSETGDRAEAHGAHTTADLEGERPWTTGSHVGRRTIADVRAEAAREIAALAGVSLDNVRVDIRIVD